MSIGTKCKFLFLLLHCICICRRLQASFYFVKCLVFTLFVRFLAKLICFVLYVSLDIGWNFLEISWKNLILSKIIPNACVHRLAHDIFSIRQ